MSAATPRWRRWLPWLVSGLALFYVFGATDWSALVAATRDANLPLFAFLVAVDVMIFFVWWGMLVAAAVRRFVTHVSTRSVVSIRGGAELLRTVNNPLADAAFLYGIARLTGGRIAAVVAAAGVPLACHFVVLVLQASLALLFIEGGAGGNRDIATAAFVGWCIVLASVLSVRTGWWRRIVESERGTWLRNVRLQTLAPLFGWFVLLAGFDVFIQGLASRAFGVPLPWWELAGSIPILYLVLSLPSFGNFGTREITWAALFAEHAPHDTLVAYALATNTMFLMLHVVIGAFFLPRAISLLGELRRARKAGEPIPRPLLHDASDP